MSVSTSSIRKITKRVTKATNTAGAFNLTPKQETMITRAAEFASIKRVNHESQLEKLKNLLEPYMFNENVVVKGSEIKGGEVKEIVLSHYESMMKAMTMYLAILNLQNKMWGLYDQQKPPSGDPAAQLNIKSASILAVQDVNELRALARNEPRAIGNGTPATDIRGAVTG